MSRKRKLADRLVQDAFTIPADHGLQDSGRDAFIIMEHTSGSRVVRQTVLIAAPDSIEPVEPVQAHRDFDNIEDLLGDTEDVETLQNSDEVIHHYIQAPGHQQKKKTPRAPGHFATTVSKYMLFTNSNVILYGSGP